GVVANAFGAIGIVDVAHFHPRGADGLKLRDGDFHVIDAEIGEKFGGAVKLMTVPGSMPPDADFWEPLTGEQEIALPSGTLQGLRELIVKSNFELDVAIGRNGLRQMNLDNSLIVFVAVFGLDEL